ncbi:MAG TPA: AAA family ATPase, partial [Candidatus Saccharimonadales bacterium]|nr:AAA family ATPase [Candidatus Saccharimonadales bacterium]
METSGLSAAQPLLVLVIGIPGSGKTFFARQFSDSYKFFCLDSGKFESELQDLNSSYEDVSKVSNKLVENTYDQALKAFRHIILTGSYNNVKQRNEVITKAQKSGYRTLIVWVQTDEETAKF